MDGPRTSKWPLRRILWLQVSVLVLVVLLGGTWGGLLLRWVVLEVPGHRRAVRSVDEHLRDAVMGANDYVASAAPTDREKFERGMSAARAALFTLGTLTKDAEAYVARLEKDLRQLETSASPIWDGEDVGARVEPMRRFDALSERAFERVDQLDGRLARAEAEHLLVNLLGLACLLGVAFGVYLGTGWLARRRYLADGAARQEELDRAIQKLGRGLDAAREDRTPPTLDVDGPLARLARKVEATRETLDDLRSEGRRRERRSRFIADLRSALELAETEAEVIQTVGRAGDVAFREQRVHLLLADNSESCLVSQSPGAPCCEPGPPSRCPVIRRHEMGQYGPDSGLGRCPHLEPTDSHVSCTFVPVNGAAVGVVQVVGDPLDREDSELLGALAYDVGARLGAVRVLDERELQAATDPLTGLANRRRMDEMLQRLDRLGTPYAIIAADLDHFKKLNDTHGHATGDRCLRIFAQVLRDSIRGDDLACRPGGEEFAVILDGASVDAASSVARRILDGLREASRRDGPAFTASLGVAAHPEHGPDARTVMRRADEALYAAKAAGRDQVVTADGESGVASRSGTAPQTTAGLVTSQPAEAPSVPPS